MRNEKKLFAIYKKGEHMGNQKSIDEIEAIEIYVIDSQFESFLCDVKFMEQYKAVVAIENLHFFKSKYINL
ncbi:hypothetical protein [Flavobacterium sp. K5-23]|uniref:hypothetical protein n=1 Tax=Flavobacterium sp. K5-23 TaxID=2746225 RepID=UPI00200E664B|nr:hypothetical protein [Flavobacterium sp. K5-23]UQD55791.1 hypothetical protein FLAK523_05015 [Flavobacterium sp. K5-23]